MSVSRKVDTELFAQSPELASSLLRYGRGAFLGAFLLITAAIIATGYVSVRHRQQLANAAANEKMAGIADLKLRQFVNWREERLSDARFFAHAPFVAADLQRLADNPGSPSAAQAVASWLKLLRGNRYYNAVIFDAQLKPLIGIPNTGGGAAGLEPGIVDRALSSQEPVIGDLHQDGPHGLIHLDILFPVFRDVEKREGILAFGLLQLDARQFLFPLVQSWPTPSKTAETLLIRREGNDVLYLNDLRHQPGTALILRLPITSSKLPAARVLLGDTNSMEGVDYRGVPVVAVGRAVPGTSWAMVAKIDVEELYAPLRRELAALYVVVGSLLLAGALVMALLWRQRGNEFLRRELLSEKERLALAERAAQLMHAATDCIFLTDTKTKIAEVNARVVETYGYSEAELVGESIEKLRAPGSRARLQEDLAGLNVRGEVRFETIHQRKDGTLFPVDISARRVSIQGSQCVLSIVRDITQQKAHERELERMNRLYAALSQVNQTIVRIKAREELFSEVCRVLVGFGDFEMAWIGWVNTQTSRVVPVAQYGDDVGYLKQVEIFADDRPQGRGPVGTAIRQQCPCIVDDFLRDVSVAPWREAVERAGWRSVAAFPVRQNGEVCAALVVYSRHAECFGPKERGLLAEAANDVSFGLDCLVSENRRKQAEDDLRQLNLELEERVRRRTVELESKNRELESFSYSVSHDLKAPLRGISGFSKMLEEQYAAQMDPTAGDYVRRIVHCADRMRQLIEDLLSYSRLEIQKPQWSVVDPREMVEGILHDFAAHVSAANTLFKINIAGGQLKTDQQGLEQALRNLIGNAIKFSAKSPQPCVEIIGNDRPDRFVLEVRDNGIGFDIQNKEKIFQVFQRLHSENEYPGTGIGLAIVRKAIERLGGTILVSSELNKGASFVLELPKRQE